MGPWNDFSDKIKYEFKLPSLLLQHNFFFRSGHSSKIFTATVFGLIVMGCVVPAAGGVVGWSQSGVSTRLSHLQTKCPPQM